MNFLRARGREPDPQFAEQTDDAFQPLCRFPPIVMYKRRASAIPIPRNSDTRNFTMKYYLLLIGLLFIPGCRPYMAATYDAPRPGAAPVFTEGSEVRAELIASRGMGFNRDEWNALVQGGATFVANNKWLRLSASPMLYGGAYHTNGRSPYFFDPDTTIPERSATKGYQGFHITGDVLLHTNTDPFRAGVGTWLGFGLETGSYTPLWASESGTPVTFGLYLVAGLKLGEKEEILLQGDLGAPAGFSLAWFRDRVGVRFSLGNSWVNNGQPLGLYALGGSYRL